MNNIQELSKIIADAPNKTTHYVNNIALYYKYYIDLNGNSLYEWQKDKWVQITKPLYFHDYRSLSDIRTIIEQAERIAELEIKSLELTALCCLICDLNECEQESEDFENIASELIDRALTVLGRTDT